MSESWVCDFIGYKQPRNSMGRWLLGVGLDVHGHMLCSWLAKSTAVTRAGIICPSNRLWSWLFCFLSEKYNLRIWSGYMSVQGSLNTPTHTHRHMHVHTHSHKHTTHTRTRTLTHTYTHSHTFIHTLTHNTLTFTHTIHTHALPCLCYTPESSMLQGFLCMRNDFEHLWAAKEGES